MAMLETLDVTRLSALLVEHRNGVVARLLEPKDAEAPEDSSQLHWLRREAKRAVGAVLIAAPLAPVSGAILSVLSLATWLHLDSKSLDNGIELWQAGIVDLVIAWAIIAGFAWVLGLSTARGALPGTYGELVQWLDEIRAWKDELNTEACPLPSLNARRAYLELCWQYTRVRRELAENGSGWFFGTAYVNVWRHVHQAQEMLVRLMSADALPEAARVELSRYAGSAIFGGADAIEQLTAALAVVDSRPIANAVGAVVGMLDRVALRLQDQTSTEPLPLPSTVVRTCDAAVAAIDDSRGMYDANSLAALRGAVQAVSNNADVLNLTPATEPHTITTVADSVRTALRGLKPSATASLPTDVEQARDVIQVLRAKMDQYRDKARSGLIRTRSDLTRTLTMTAMIAYALLWIVIEARFAYELYLAGGLTQQQLTAINVIEMTTGALGVFLWGAIVGLFGQLWSKWNVDPNASSDAGEDDFGLGISRVIAEPVLAGVAGMCGVVLLTFGGEALTQGLTQLTSPNAAVALTTLKNAFLPGTYPASLLYAAVFALSPSLLISRIQQASAGLRQNLSTSSAGDGGGTAR